MYVIALAGNQNSGKTTLYNNLTGSNQHVGNFPGVTIEKKEGLIKKHKDISIVDLPGIYSLSPYTMEEVVTRDFLLKENPDLILNIVDATNIERNLYLTLQLMDLSIPIVIALNMMDEVTASGNSIDVKKLSCHLGVPVVPISASKGEGISELIDVVIKTVKEKSSPKKLDFCVGEVHKAIHSISHLIDEQAEAAGYPVRFAATKLVEGDEPTIKSLKITENQLHIIEHVVKDMEAALQTDREAALADMRYCYIEQICSETVVKKQETKEQQRSEKFDEILTHKYFGIPIFFGIIFFIFWMTFNVIGAPLQGLLEELIGAITEITSNAMIAFDVSDWLHSLVIGGIFAGVGSVLSFLPLIVILFFFLSLLEDSGYMARVAFSLIKPE